MKESTIEKAEKQLQQRKLTIAISCFNVAEVAGEDADRCSAGRWLAYMLLGDFEAAWRESDRIRAHGCSDPHRFWQGEDLHGKRVILRCLHGLGDTVQMLRYVPVMNAIVSSLIIEITPALHELAPMFEGVIDFITWGEKAPADPPLWDVQIETNELPYFFRTQVNELPISTDYLRLPTEVLRKCAPHSHDHLTLRIGVVWASGEWNLTRGVPFDSFRTLFDTCGCEFWNLQGDASRKQWQQLPLSPTLHDAEFCANNVVDLAGLIAQLDVIVTSDTLAAHLAGALGKPTLVMLEYAADWRWQHQRTDSPWYPTLQLIRQTEVGDWSTVIAEVQSLLHVLASQKQQQFATR
jgi:hypothetical protein